MTTPLKAVRILDVCSAVYLGELSSCLLALSPWHTAVHYLYATFGSYYDYHHVSFYPCNEGTCIYNTSYNELTVRSEACSVPYMIRFLCMLMGLKKLHVHTG